MLVRRLQKYEGPAEKFAFAQKLSKMSVFGWFWRSTTFTRTQIFQPDLYSFAIWERVWIEETLSYKELEFQLLITRIGLGKKFQSWPFLSGRQCHLSLKSEFQIKSEILKINFSVVFYSLTLRLSLPTELNMLNKIWEFHVACYFHLCVKNYWILSKNR